MNEIIATDTRRQLYENFSLFIRNFLPRYPQPEADAIENLSMACVFVQRPAGHVPGMQRARQETRRGLGRLPGSLHVTERRRGARTGVCRLGGGQYAASGFFDNDKKLADYSPEEMDLRLYGKDRKTDTLSGGESQRQQDGQAPLAAAWWT